MRNRLRIFISSPADVNEERLRAHLVIQKLARDYARFFQIEPYLWEYEPMLASGHFQDAIEPPSASDVVILIVYSRLGTPLPERTASGRQYVGIDGRAPVTGTEWEYEEALAAHRAKGAPDLLAYRKIGDPGLSLTDAARRADQEHQWQSLEGFWRRHFEDNGVFIAGSSRFRTVDEFDKKLEADLTAMIERRISEGMQGRAAQAETTWLRGSPFRGLASYEFSDAAIFFGRDAQTRTALTRLQSAANSGCAFLLVLGASGSGKSSVARAGILPALFAPKAIPEVGIWRRVVFRPNDGGQDPILRLATALVTGDPANGEGLPEILSANSNVDALAAHLAASADNPAFPFNMALDRVADAARGPGGLLLHETARLVILVDQLEELFTRNVDPERRKLFIRILAGLARSGRVWVVATMRNDLWHRAAETPALLEMVEAGARLDLLRPNGSEVIEIIRRPAAAAGIAFETDSQSGIGLDAVIAGTASEEPGVLPLLSVLLETLYERDIASLKGDGGRSNVLTFETYRALGELKGAIAQRADAVLSALSAVDPDAAAAFPQVLRALVTASPTGETVASRPARLDSFPEGSPAARLITAFLDPQARLLVASATASGAEVRLAHEALIENWPTAREQVRTDRRDLETRSRIEGLNRRWRDAPSDAEKKRALLRGLNLAEGTDLAKRWGLDPNGDLGTYVRMSARADRMRRNWVLASSAALVLVFAGIAALAGLESIRADGERARAVTALRATQREAAATLAAQAQLASNRHDTRRALSLAVKAAETERDALEPGGYPISQPALLKAMADVRQVVHIQRPTGGIAMPFDFYGDTLLVHADPKGGVVLTDLSDPPKIAMRANLPAGPLPSQLRAAPSAGIVAVGIGRRLLIIDARTGQTKSDILFASRITALDVHDERKRLVVSTATSFSILNLATGSLSEPVELTGRADTAIGQVRFTRSGDGLLLSAGTAVLEYDLTTRRFAAGIKAELDATRMGIDKPLLESVLAKALIVVVEIAPDMTRDRLLMRHVGEVKELASSGSVRVFEREEPALQVLGISFADQARAGGLKEAIAVLNRPRDTEQELQLRYVSDGEKMLTFERFNVPMDDVAGEKLSSCKVSLNVSHLVCQYWGKKLEGLVVWRLLGGAHRFERLVARQKTSWGEIVSATPPQVVMSEGPALMRWTGGVETRVGELSPGWSLLGRRGPYYAAASASGNDIQIWRLTDGDQTLLPAFGPIKGVGFEIESERVVISEPDRISTYEMKTGRRLASMAGLEGLAGIALSPDGRRVAAITGSSVYVFDAENGRLERSFPIKRKQGAFAFDRGVMQVAYVDDAGALLRLGLGDGITANLDPEGPNVVRLVWTPDGRLLIGGLRDGGLKAWGSDRTIRWSVESPLGQAFSEKIAWPDQPPKGQVLSLTVSQDGKRLAVIRQDLPAVELHEVMSGRQLTQLTTPWSFGVPARLSLDGGLLLTSWAVHAMTRDKPTLLSLHTLPEGLDATLLLAQARLRQLETIWTAAGPAGN